MAQQQKTQQTHAVEALDSDKAIVEATAILNPLRGGLARIYAQIDSSGIEMHLGALPPTDGRADRRRGRPAGSRNDLLKDRLAKNRGVVPHNKPDELVSDDLPPAVSLALEIVQNARSAPVLLDRKALLAQLRRDAAAVERGIAAQQRVIDTLRDELRYARVLKDEAAWFGLQVRRFRAYQAAAAIDDEMRDFQKARFDGGYGWRPDVLPELGMRVMLTLGSERDHTSELSKMRQRLEEAKKI